MTTTETPTSPAQQSPIRWWQSQLGLGIAWLVLGVALLLYMTVEIVLGRADLINAAIGGRAA